MRISDWSSDVCSSDLPEIATARIFFGRAAVDGRPIIGQLDLRHVALPGGGEKDQGEAADLVIETAGFLQPDQLEEIDGGIGIRRSEERRVRNECVRQGRSRWCP